jgi:chromosome segregation ATPase
MARRAVQEKEAAAEQMQSVLQRLEGEQAATAASGERMAAVLAGLEAVVAERAAAVAALEAEMAAGHGDVESNTHQLEGLNRRYQRLVDNAKDVETGGKGVGWLPEGSRNIVGVARDKPAAY